MKLLRYDSAEVTTSIASARTLACLGWSVLTLVCIASASGLLAAVIVSLTVSVRAAIWLGVPVVLALNGYLLWRGRSPRLNWVIAVCADRVFVRMFVQRGGGQSDTEEPDVIMFEASEIASISSRTVEVFLNGPRPRSIDWLVLEPVQAALETVSNHVRPLLMPPGKQVYVANEGGRLVINWEWCRPGLRAFLQQIARKCLSVSIAPEARSELDLNGISHDLSGKPNAEQRKMLVQAMRLGFGCDCAALLARSNHISFRKAGVCLADFEREEAGTEQMDGLSLAKFSSGPKGPTR
jgi:multidrug transporter EmrE-like cation transporter